MAMNNDCYQVQSMVESFLAEKLSASDNIMFINHVQKCKACMDELEVYHVIYSVAAQLDNEKGNESSDYIAELHKKLDYKIKVNNRRGTSESLLKALIISVVCIAIIIIGVILTGLW